MLLRVDPQRGTGQAVGNNANLGFAEVYGLFAFGDRLMGLTAAAPRCRGGGALIDISMTRGTSSFRRCLEFAPYGATRLYAGGRDTPEPEVRTPTATLPPTTTTTLPRTPARAPDIRGIDFLNRAYSGADCPMPVTLSNGVGQNDGNEIRATAPTYADITGDGAEDAVVVFEMFAIGGNANTSCIAVFTTQGGGLTVAGTIKPSAQVGATTHPHGPTRLHERRTDRGHRASVRSERPQLLSGDDRRDHLRLSRPAVHRGFRTHLPVGGRRMISATPVESIVERPPTVPTRHPRLIEEGPTR